MSCDFPPRVYTPSTSMHICCVVQYFASICVVAQQAELHASFTRSKTRQPYIIHASLIMFTDPRRSALHVGRQESLVAHWYLGTPTTTTRYRVYDNVLKYSLKELIRLYEAECSVQGSFAVGNIEVGSWKNLFSKRTHAQAAEQRAGPLVVRMRRTPQTVVGFWWFVQAVCSAVWCWIVLGLRTPSMPPLSLHSTPNFR